MNKAVIIINVSHCSGLVMIGVIIGSRKVGINPDNVATPIAASLGDLITLSLLAGVSSALYQYRGTHNSCCCCCCNNMIAPADGSKALSCIFTRDL